MLNALREIQTRLGVQLTPRVADILMEEYHAAIGSMLAKKWSLPEWVPDVMIHHEDYDGAQEHKLEAMMGHLAAELAAWADGCDEKAAGRLENLPVCKKLGITAEDIQAILGQTGHIVELAEVYR